MPDKLLTPSLLCALLLLLSLLSIHTAPTLTPPPLSPALANADGKLIHARLSPSSEYSLPLPLSQMGKHIPSITVQTEDGRFYRHIGIDPLAVLRALVQNSLALRTVSGASTITAQTVRLTISEPAGLKRTLWTKLTENIRAIMLEQSMTKDEILECYLNNAPFGGNIRGVNAASLVYFGKSPAQLSPGEACLLVGMLKSPSRYRPDLHPKEALKRRNDVISLMERKRVLSHEEASRARMESLPRRKYPLPANAWHFSSLALSRKPVSPGIIRTTLRSDVQSKMENILREAIMSVPDDVTFAAGIVENETASLIAWTGDARFMPGTAWVDCGRSPRSPGSALKPFAYIAAIDAGMITPSSLIADTEHSFSGRAPRNFDRTYRGAVTARTALSESLNAPAARVLRMAGPGNVMSLLRNAGFNHLTHNPGYYGDSLILGGCEVTLLELLEAFTSIASSGIHRPLRIFADDNPPAVRIASEASCWMVSDILRHEGTNTAVKTGTSYGLRDAWSCAWNAGYTVCVWAGKHDGSSWDGLIGARICTPVALSLHSILPRSKWHARPDSIIPRKVCALSGKPPTSLCHSVKYDWSVSGVSRTVPCDIHGVKGAVNMPDDFGLPSSGNFAIISPVPGASYFNAALDISRKIPFRSEGSRGNVFWYVDGEYAGKSGPGMTFFHSLDDGTHTVSAVDGGGRSDAVTVRVFTPGKGGPAEKLF